MKKLITIIVILIAAFLLVNLIFAADAHNQAQVDNAANKATSAFKNFLVFLNDLYQWVNSKINFSKLIYFIKDAFVFIFELLIKSIRFILSYLR